MVRLGAILLVLLCYVACTCRPVPVALPSGIPKNQQVVLQFERNDAAADALLLRLTNYTAWSIRIPVELPRLELAVAAKQHADGAEAPVRYYLEPYDPSPHMQITYADGRKSPPDEPEHPPVPVIHRVDFFTEWWVPPNQSVTFRVPKADLARNIQLFVRLRYEWESLGVETITGPEHRASYRGVDLPAEVQATIR